MIERLKGAFHWLLELFFWLIIFVCMAASLTVITSDGRFGSTFRTFGVVQSGSMKASGLERGDIVFVDKTNDFYDVGDVILFYRTPYNYGKRAKDVDLRLVEVWVHEIIEVGEDELGRRTYLTKGTSNAYDDGYFVPEDFVLGEAVPLPETANMLIKFLLSSWGIVIAIVVPSFVLFVLFTIEFIRLFIEMYKEIGEEEAAKEIAAKARMATTPYPMLAATSTACRANGVVGLGDCRVCPCATCPINQTCGFCVACRVGRAATAYAIQQHATTQAHAIAQRQQTKETLKNADKRSRKKHTK